MADKKISELPLRATVLPTDQFANSADNVTWRSPIGAIPSFTSADAASISVGPQKHIMRRAIGSSDCPCIEASTSGESGNNAAKLKAALEEFGWLDAGAFGAAWDMGNVKPDMLTTPVLGIEGNGSQTFVMQPGVFTNIEEGNQYGSTAALFQFEGTITGNGLSSVAVNYGGEAHLCGVNIIGPGTGTGTQRVTNPVLGRFLDRLFVEGCDISNCQRGQLIAAVAVRYGGRLNGNHLHDCIYDAGLNASGYDMEMWGIGLDDNKPVNDGIVIPDRYVAWCDGFEIAGNVIDRLTAINPVGTVQTDGINLQMLTRNHRIHDNRISNVGDGLDGGPWNSIISDNLFSDSTLGLKLLYGMNNTLVSGNVITDIGELGISISGSGFDGIPTQDNFLIGNKVHRVNMALVSVTSAALHINFVAANPPTTNGTIAGYLRRLFIRDNVLDPQGNARTILIQGESDNMHIHNNHEIVRGSAIAYTNQAPAAGRLQTAFSYKQPEDPSPYFASAYLSTDSAAIPNTTLTDITGWAEITDRSNEFNPTTGVYTCAAAGNRRIHFQVTIEGIVAAVTAINVFVRITRTPSGSRDWTFKGGDVPTSDGIVTISGSVDEIIVAAGDTIKLSVQVIGDATSKISGIAGSFYFTSFGVSGV